MRKNTLSNKKRILIKVSFCLIGLGVLFSGCRKENEAEYFKTNSDTTVIDTTYVTYSKQIKPMFDAKCVSCHVGGTAGNCDLDSYQNSINYIYSHQPHTKLYDYVKDVQNPHAGVIMDTLELKQLSKWILNPAP